jgi:Ca-activated chloride channel family protein
MTTSQVRRLDGDGTGRTRGLGIVQVGGRGRKSVLPLAGLKIEARAAGRIAHVTVEQTFENRHAEPLEAVYIFPLAAGCAVGAFDLRVGDRTIRGLVREREAARREYAAALKAGRRSGLLEKERDDVFTVRVGNLPPGEAVRARISYSEVLPAFADGTTEIRLPLVVAPRYIPGAPLDGDGVGDGTEADSDEVPDASRITPPRLAKGFNPETDLAITVELAGGPVEEFACSQHAVRLADGKLSLARQDELLDRDFVLRWRIAGPERRSSLLVHREPDGKAYGVLTLLPPPSATAAAVAPRDVLLVLDRSGSMSGVKMASASRACAQVLATLGPEDRFAIIAFGSTVERFRPGLTGADEDSIAAGGRYLRGVTADGGTEVLGALKEAFRTLAGETGNTRRTAAVVLITDGQVGNESAVLKEVKKARGKARLFTVGIDTAVNAGVLRRAAEVGGGTATLVVPGEPLEEALRCILRELGEPLIRDLRIENAEDPAPELLPDVFPGRAATVFFRLEEGAARIRVRGRLAAGVFEEEVWPEAVELPAIARLWARARTQDLEDRFRGGEKDVRDEIVALAVAHVLLTRFTAFVVVDEQEVVNPDGTTRKVVQPVHVPAGWEQEEAGEVFAMRLLSTSHVRYRRALVDADDDSASMVLSRIEPSAGSWELPAFVHAFWVEGRRWLEAGALPDPAVLERALTDCLDQLTGWKRSTRRLVKFLRGPVQAWIDDLKAPGADPSALLARLDGLLEALAKVNRLLYALLRKPRFWESSV